MSNRNQQDSQQGTEQKPGTGQQGNPNRQQQQGGHNQQSDKQKDQQQGNQPGGNKNQSFGHTDTN